MSQRPHYRIIGVDPGFGRVGWGVIEQRAGDWAHLAHGCIETTASRPFIERLQEIKADLMAIITMYSPTRAAVEDLFFYKNITTAMKVGQARGVILLSLVEAGLPVSEVAPLQVKQALTGYGRANKSQIQKMVQLQLGMKQPPRPDDAADALAVAITGAAVLWSEGKT